MTLQQPGFLDMLRTVLCIMAIGAFIAGAAFAGAILPFLIAGVLP